MIVIDNLSSGSLDHIRALLGHSRFQFVEGDLLDTELLLRLMAGTEFVYHLAANPDVKYVCGDPTDKDLKQNTLASYNVLEAMRLAGVRNLVFSSTSAVYGLVERLPIREDCSTQPISLYGATKLSCEALISAFHHLFGFRCWIFRFANIVGPKVRTRGRTVISDFISKLRDNPRRLPILGNGNQEKSYLLAKECVDGILFSVGHSSADFTVLNLGCSDAITVTRIAQMVVEAMGLSEVEFAYTGTPGGWPGDVPRFLLDVTAINKIGWHARHTSEQAVGMAIQAQLERDSPAGQDVCRP